MIWIVTVLLLFVSLVAVYYRMERDMMKLRAEYWEKEAGKLNHTQRYGEEIRQAAHRQEKARQREKVQQITFKVAHP